MQLKELNYDEKLALTGLSNAILMADGMLKGKEIDEVDSLVKMLDGEDEYKTLMVEADNKFQEPMDLINHLKTITRQEARNLIFATVYEESLSDLSISEPMEQELLTWLKEEWQIDIQIKDEEAE